MRISLSYVTPMLAAGAVAAAIAAAPIAAAAVPAAAQTTCSSGAPGTRCQTPGNVQINDSMPPVQFDPYGGMGYLLGRH
jgi:hypothetical protein